MEYSERTWPLIQKELTIIPEEHRVVCESGSKHFEHLCDEMQWKKLEKLIEDCNFSAWEDEYYSPALDGTEWNLGLHESDGQIKKSKGMNAYPDKWHAFAVLLDYCAEITGFEPETDEQQLSSLFFLNKSSENK